MRATPDPLPLAAALIAGGRSTRMGRDKAWLDWRGRPLWQVQLGKLLELKPVRLLIACREEQRIATPQAEVLHDPPDHQGPLPALLRCLAAAQMPMLSLAVDMPGITVALLRELVAHCSEPPCGAVFQSEHGYEPLCAVYPAAALPLLRQSLGQGNLRLQTFVQQAVNAKLLRAIPLAKDQEPLFFNLNSPADLTWTPPPPSP